MRVTDGDVDAPVGLVFNGGEKETLEGASKEEAEGCVLDNMSMELEGDVANLHEEVFCTTESPGH
jgi:hypothetical protein